MKKIIQIYLVCFFLYDLCVAQSQFQKAIGGTGNDTAYSSTLTTDGGYVLSGVTCSFGAGLCDFYIVKFDSINNLQWSRTIGGTNYDFAFSCIQTRDGGYALAGETNSFGAGIYNFYVVKLTSIGALQWNKTIGGSEYDYAWSIKQTFDGGYVVGGSTNSFGAGFDDMYIVKLDSNGAMQWNRTVGGTDQDNAFSILQSTDGGYVVAGRTASFSQGGFDVYIVKLNGNGTLQWSRTIGGSADDHVGYIIQTTDGGYAAVGGTTSFGAGNYDFYIVKFDGYGNLQWSRTVGGSGSDRSYWITQTRDGGLAVAGWTNSFGAGGYDVYIVKLSSSGTLQWSKTVGELNSEYARTIMQEPNGNYIVGGLTYSFGAGNNDFYIVKLDSNGSTCGNTSSPSSISGSGGIVSNPNSIVHSPTPTFTSPSPSLGTGGILSTLCVIGIRSISNEIPSNYSLDQNYPNPFNPATKIKFDISSGVKRETSNVKLIIFDILGREVATLVNEQLKPGSYEVEWDASNYPSGAYFYKLLIEDASAPLSITKKMVLVK